MRVAANGVELNAEQSGEGIDLLFLPGLGGNTNVWHAQSQRLRSAARVTCLDPRGHGLSDRPAGPYDIRTFAADTAAVINALGLEHPVVVASSMSCAVAIEVAASSPRDVGALVLVGGFASLPAAGRERMEGRARTVETGGMAAVVDQVIATALAATTHATQPALVGLFKAMLLGNDPLAYAASARAVAAADVTEQLAGVRCPTLVVMGEDEQVAPLAAARQLVRGIAGARMSVIASAGHLPFLEQPGPFNALLLEFIGTL